MVINLIISKIEREGFLKINPKNLWKVAESYKMINNSETNEFEIRTINIVEPLTVGHFAKIPGKVISIIFWSEL